MTFSVKTTIAAVAVFATIFGANHSYGATNDLSDVKAEIAKRHDEALKRLQDWIALPSIAAENRNYPAGAEYMAKLARDAGFQQVTVKRPDGVMREGECGWVSPSGSSS